MFETYLRRNTIDGYLIISEACGGVIESNMTVGTDLYLPMTLEGYLSRCLVGEIEICYYKF